MVFEAQVHLPELSRSRALGHWCFQVGERRKSQPRGGRHGKRICFQKTRGAVRGPLVRH